MHGLYVYDICADTAAMAVQTFPSQSTKMALINCSECRNEVSTNAAACLKCGNPIAANPKISSGGRAFILWMFFWPLRILRVLLGLLGASAVYGGLMNLSTALRAKSALERLGLNGDQAMSHTFADAVFIVFGMLCLLLFVVHKKILRIAYKARTGSDHPNLSKKFWAL